MKIKLGIVGLVLLSVACAVYAQDAAQSSVDLGNRANEPARTPEPATTIEPPKPIEPPEVNTPAPPTPEVPELSTLDEAFKQSSLGKDADDFHTRVEWRKLQNDAANDPDVVAAKIAAGRTKTDLEKRERLKDYYDIYYAKMNARASGPEMRKALAQFKLEHLKRLAQPKVRPNSDLPMETPTPARVKKHKK